MNKFAAAGLVAEAELGKRILVVSDHMGDVVAEFDAHVRDRESVRKVVRVNGGERIDFQSGGAIIFTSPRSHRSRGITVDTVFIDWDADTAHPYLLERYRPNIDGNPLGEMIRA